MSEGPTTSDTARLLAGLHKAQPGKHEVVKSSAEVSPELRLLQKWQAARLATTHHDLLADPRYEPAAILFLEDVYGPQDFSQRNHDMERFYDGVAQVLPDRAVSVLSHVVELNTLTEEMDQQLITMLVEELSVTDSISVEQYAEAYRMCDNYDQRVEQIELVTRIGQEIDRLVNIRFVGMALRLAHTPAVLAGWSELQGFLERGYAAFKHMNGADDFLQIVSTRETQILDQIYAGDPHPFEISDAANE